MSLDGCCDEGEAPRAVIGWTVWADDGKVYYGTSPDQFEDLPDDGILIVKLFYADGRDRIVEGGDWYFTAIDSFGDPIYGSSTFSDRPDPARYRNLITKRGRWVSDAWMEQVDELARKATFSGNQFSAN